MLGQAGAPIGPSALLKINNSPTANITYKEYLKHFNENISRCLANFVVQMVLFKYTCLRVTEDLRPHI